MVIRSDLYTTLIVEHWGNRSADFIQEELTLRLSLEKVDFRQPTQVTDDTSILTLKNLVFEPLLKWQPAGLAGPGLFGSWEHSPDGRSIDSQFSTQSCFLRENEICKE